MSATSFYTAIQLLVNTEIAHKSSFYLGKVLFIYPCCFLIKQSSSSIQILLCKTLFHQLSSYLTNNSFINTASTYTTIYSSIPLSVKYALLSSIPYILSHLVFETAVQSYLECDAAVKSIT